MPLCKMDQLSGSHGVVIVVVVSGADVDGDW